MDKRTLLAVVLSVVIISVGFMIQNVLWPPEIPETADGMPGTTPGETGTTTREDGTIGDGRGETTESRDTTEERDTAITMRRTVIPAEREEPLQERTYTIETDVFVATLTNRGGELESLYLKEHTTEGEPINMVYKGETDIDPFFITFGGPEAQPVDTLFDQSIRGQHGIEYRRTFLAPSGPDGVSRPFTLIKTYTFQPTEYMFELEITIENSVNDYPNLDFDGTAYTLGYGPQIGPYFEELKNQMVSRGEYRRYYTYESGKRKNNTLSRSGELLIQSRYNWTGIVGKYFALLAVPDDAQYALTFEEKSNLEGIPLASYMYLSRPFIRSSKNTDVFRIYAGPKLKKHLSLYNDPADNPYGYADLNLDEAVDTSAILGWLESILKFFLDLFYRIIPNYGVAIILLTLLVKALLFPITRKSYESTSKMQALNPKIQEIREKYKDNPNRMNQEMAALYKKEKVSPLGGCLPLLLQMPVFIALYGVLTKHFALRGEEFFWWITDLSQPDSAWNFAPFQLPLLGWSDLRVLPILFVGTQVLSSKFMQQPGTAQNKNMKMMGTVLPVVFFFILYNAPSGLILYWTITNVLTVAQQRLIAKYRRTHPGGDEETGGAKSSGGSKSGPGSGSTGGSGGRGPGGGKKKKPGRS